jgi:hypothetical protein
VPNDIARGLDAAVRRSMRSTAIRWNFREYRFRFTLQFLPLQSVPIPTVSIQGFSPFWPVDLARNADDIGELAKELGVTRRCLNKWRTKLDYLERRNRTLMSRVFASKSIS